jgi:acyl-CoA synthetase (AMP-forming)/AMP-acid ligase II
MPEATAATTIPDALYRAAERWPDDEAVVGDGGERWTFADLLDRSRQVGRALVAAGVEPGDRVALWAPNSPAWIAASFGVYLTGAVLVPLNSRYRGEEAAHVLRTSGARLLITVTDLLGRSLLAELDAAADPPRWAAGEPTAMAGEPGTCLRVVLSGQVPPGAVDWDAFLARGDGVADGEVDQRARAVAPGDRSDIIFTSGTTGAAKGAVLGHGASVRTYTVWADQVGLRHDDRYLIVYPFFHTAGLKSGVLACVLTGATMVPHAVFEPAAVMQRVVDERITMLPGTPTVFQGILDAPERPGFDLSSLRLSVTGAAVVPVAVIERMREELRFEKVVTGYGLTETTGTVSMCHHEDPPEVVAHTVGKPLPGVEVRIVDRQGRVVAGGEPGEIQVRGYNVMQGYFNAPEATAATVDAEGWLATGDVGLLDDQGNIRITDRVKDMYIVGGFNAYPAEIEGQILRHPDVAQVAVVGVPDDRMGEVGVAFVVPRPGHEIDPAALVAWCRERMANFKVPRRVVPTDALPLNAMGKVVKYELRARYAEGVGR